MGDWGMKGWRMKAYGDRGSNDGGLGDEGMENQGMKGWGIGGSRCAPPLAARGRCGPAGQTAPLAPPRALRPRPLMQI